MQLQNLIMILQWKSNDAFFQSENNKMKNISNLLSGNIIKISEGKAIIIASYESQKSADEVSTQIKEVLGQLKQFVNSEFNRSTGSVFDFSSDDSADPNFYAVTHFI